MGATYYIRTNGVNRSSSIDDTPFYFLFIFQYFLFFIKFGTDFVINDFVFKK